MLGVLVNVITVMIGSLIGLIFKKGIPERVNRYTMIGLGFCILYIGISGCLQGENSLLLIASVVLGSVCGTLLDIDGFLNRTASQIENKFKKNNGQNSLAEGMVSASLLFCIGAMTVTGSIQAGLVGDNSILITKAMLDLVSAIMLASTLGFGVFFSAFVVLIVQGALVLCAGLLEPFISGSAINELTCTGSILIMMIGTNMIGITKIKVANFLPAIIFSPLFYNLATFITKMLVR